ncbi:MAG: penicillin-insensitive murein endopeptidase [Bdellovibrionaceae bacterium]|nr:penicillin-insensitive murein endopeptidase [Pseudobdellovibrionaceae bacterium]
MNSFNYIVTTLLIIFTFTEQHAGAQTSDIRMPPGDEQLLAPWLDFRGGGHAVGPTQTLQRKNPDGKVTPWYGGLQNGTLLPASGDGFVRLNSPDTSWGTGMMISLIQNSTAYFVGHYPMKNKVYVASIAQEHGGPYGPHNSHQNGLDGDILFMGQTKYGTVLDDVGQVTSKFNPELNWAYWKLISRQKIVIESKPVSAVYMIFVAPVLKDYLCNWATQNGMLSDPENAEIMRRLRRTAGHDTHFHVRLRCSPYYADCNQLGDIAAGTGCD